MIVLAPMLQIGVKNGVGHQQTGVQTIDRNTDKHASNEKGIGHYEKCKRQ